MSNYHSRRLAANAFKVVESGITKSFEVDNFAGTGHTVIWNNWNGVLTYQGTTIELVYIPGLGYTVAPGQSFANSQVADLYHKLNGTFWSGSITRTPLSEVTADNGVTYTAKGEMAGDPAFLFAEHTWVRQNSDGSTSNMYSCITNTLDSYALTLRYAKLQPVTTSLSTEYYASGVKYITEDGSVTVYEDKDGGLWEEYDSATGT